VGDVLSSAATTTTRKAAFWWTLVSNFARRSMPRATTKD
jgi:hypothetical protein